MRHVYHKEIESSGQADPRANQKARTRAALVDAASALLRQGHTPSVAEAADEARVSRATAYRYFPTQEALLVEIAGLAPAVAPMEALVADFGSADPEERLVKLVTTLNRIVFTEEVSMRTALRVYLDTWLEARRRGDDVPSVREGRRMRWLEQALEPVRDRLTKRQWRRLQSALALTLSIDSMVVMKDVCRLDDNAAIEVLDWAAVALLRAGLAEARPAVRSRAKR